MIITILWCLFVLKGKPYNLYEYHYEAKRRGFRKNASRISAQKLTLNYHFPTFKLVFLVWVRDMNPTLANANLNANMGTVPWLLDCLHHSSCIYQHMSQNHVEFPQSDSLERMTSNIYIQA